MDETKNSSGLDEVLTLDQVREALGESGFELSEKDLELVRVSAADVLSKISDLKTRECSVVAVVRQKLNILHDYGAPVSPERAAIHEAFFRARALFEKLDHGRAQEFFDLSYLRGDRLMMILLGVIGSEASLVAALDRISGRLEMILERFGQSPIGQSVIVDSTHGSVITRIASVDRRGYLYVKGRYGRVLPKFVRRVPDKHL